MKQYFSSRLSANGVAASTRYMHLVGDGTTVTTAAYVEEVCSAAGTLGDWDFLFNSAPGSGESIGITIVKNGSDALTVTVSGTSTGGTSASTVSVAAGDYVYYKLVASGLAICDLSWFRFSFTGTTANESLVMGSGSSTTANVSANRYVGLYGTSLPNATAASMRQTIPAAGALSHLYVRLGVAPGTSPDAYSVTLYKNGSATALTCTITAPNRSGSDVSNSVSVAVTDLVYLEIVPLNSPSNSPRISWGLKFTATTDGESIVMAGGSDNIDTTNTEYNFLSQSGGSWSGTEANFRSKWLNQTVFNGIAVNLATAPTAGRSCLFTLRMDGAASGLSCTIADTATSSSATATVDVGADSLLCIEHDPTGSPAVGDAYWGLRQYIAPAAGARRVMLIS